MTQTKAHQAEVLAHYRELAPKYAASANQTCERVYHRLVRRFMQGRSRLLELGGGSSNLLDSLASPLAVACDLSLEMLLMRPSGPTSHRVVAVGERLPFETGRFEGVFSINVLEHVTDLEQVMAESARVLERGGLCLAVTPNGNWEALLDLAERFSLKIPEGPHQFLTTRQLREGVDRFFDVVEHQTMLVAPAGPSWLSECADRLSLCSVWGWGFFQYIVGRKRSDAAAA